MEIRQDITGLRAIAVILVVAGHIQRLIYPTSTVLQGGWVGVDIFFVISGFLMCHIIWRDLEAGKFSLSQFYSRRMRRICPALLSVILCCLILGLLVFPTSDLVRLALGGYWALLMGSNFFFAFNTAYFGQSALDQPLLHTWSLGVEFQFYILFPFLLIALKRYIAPSWQGKLLIALVVVCLTSSREIPYA